MMLVSMIQGMWGFDGGCVVGWQRDLVQEEEACGRRWWCCRSKQEEGCYVHQEEDCGRFLMGLW